MFLRTATMLLLMAVPLSGLAGPYKCKAPDGKVSFQDQPCQAGSTGGQITIKTTPADPEAVAAAKRAATREATTKQARDELRSRNDQIEAHNRQVRCGNARQRLGILKEQRPVFRYDNKGERQYIDDASRQSEIAAAERSVAENCN